MNGVLFAGTRDQNTGLVTYGIGSFPVGVHFLILILHPADDGGGLRPGESGGGAEAPVRITLDEAQLLAGGQSLGQLTAVCRHVGELRLDILIHHAQGPDHPQRRSLAVHRFVRPEGPGAEIALEQDAPGEGLRHIGIDPVFRPYVCDGEAVVLGGAAHDAGHQLDVLPPGEGLLWSVGAVPHAVDDAGVCEDADVFVGPMLRSHVGKAQGRCRQGQPRDSAQGQAQQEQNRKKSAPGLSVPHEKSPFYSVVYIHNNKDKRSRQADDLPDPSG